MVWYGMMYVMVQYGTVWLYTGGYMWMEGPLPSRLPDVTGRASEPPSSHLFSVKLFF